jgi:hypothetical protein
MSRHRPKLGVGLQKTRFSSTKHQDVLQAQISPERPSGSFVVVFVFVFSIVIAIAIALALDLCLVLSGLALPCLVFWPCLALFVLPCLVVCCLPSTFFCGKCLTTIGYC